MLKKEEFLRKMIEEHKKMFGEDEFIDLIDKNYEQFFEIIEFDEKLQFYYNSFRFTDSVLNIGQISCFSKQYDNDSIFVSFRKNILNDRGIFLMKKK